MSASLVGSEMCIRDRPCTSRNCCETWALSNVASRLLPFGSSLFRSAPLWFCLLYTSDAADDM
eukprot:13898198-Alexandrium_andersonii.AAC.1